MSLIEAQRILDRAARRLLDTEDGAQPEPLARGAVGLDAHIHRQHHSVSGLDSFDDLLTDPDTASEAIQVGRDENIGSTLLDHGDRFAESGTILERTPARHVQLLKDFDQAQAASNAFGLDPISLLTGRVEALAGPTCRLRYADDSNCLNHYQSNIPACQAVPVNAVAATTRRDMT